MGGQVDETSELVPKQATIEETAAPEPLDLKSAFLKYESGFKKDDGSQEQPASMGEDGSESTGATSNEGREDQLQPSGDIEEHDGGRSGNELLDVTGISTEDYTREMSDRIFKIAQREVKAQFAKDNKRHITAMDLRQIDDKGNVTYYNPDNPNQPFRDNQYRNALSQAREWADNYNARVDADYEQTLNKRMGELAQAVKPSIDFMRFSNDVLPYLSDAEVQCLDMLVERYEIKDKQGNVIGYKCDLYEEAALAKRMAAQYTSQQEPMQQSQNAQPQTQPAVDMNTASSAANAAAAQKEPKNINEAMRMVNAKYKRQ